MKKFLLSTILPAIALMAFNANAQPANFGTLTISGTVVQGPAALSPSKTNNPTHTTKETNYTVLYKGTTTNKTINTAYLLGLLGTSLSNTFTGSTLAIDSTNNIYVVSKASPKTYTPVSSVLTLDWTAPIVSGAETTNNGVSNAIISTGFTNTIATNVIPSGETLISSNVVTETNITTNSIITDTGTNYIDTIVVTNIVSPISTNLTVSGTNILVSGTNFVVTGVELSDVTNITTNITYMTNGTPPVITTNITYVTNLDSTSNLVITATNLALVGTNLDLSGSDILILETNVLTDAGTNIIVAATNITYMTNTSPITTTNYVTNGIVITTNIVYSTTNIITSTTNTTPASTNIFSTTNYLVSGTSLVISGTNIVSGTNLVISTTNEVVVGTNVVTLETTNLPVSLTNILYITNEVTTTNIATNIITATNYTYTTNFAFVTNLTVSGVTITHGTTNTGTITQMENSYYTLKYNDTVHGTVFSISGAGTYAIDYNIGTGKSTESLSVSGASGFGTISNLSSVIKGSSITAALKGTGQ